MDFWIPAVVYPGENRDQNDDSAMEIQGIIELCNKAL